MTVHALLGEDDLRDLLKASANSLSSPHSAVSVTVAGRLTLRSSPAPRNCSRAGPGDKEHAWCAANPLQARSMQGMTARITMPFPALRCIVGGRKGPRSRHSSTPKNTYLAGNIQISTKEDVHRRKGRVTWPD